MSNYNLRKLAKNTFAGSLFLFGMMYITNAAAFATYLAPLPGAIVVVYVTAFVEVSVACSIIMKMQVRNACIVGGIYIMIIALIIFSAGIYRGSTRADTHQINEAIINLISSVGYASAIFYIGYTEEDNS